MLRKHVGQGRDGQEDAERRAVLSVEVFIEADGRVTVDGAPFPCRTANRSTWPSSTPCSDGRGPGADPSRR